MADDTDRTGRTEMRERLALALAGERDAFDDDREEWLAEADAALAALSPAAVQHVIDMRADVEAVERLRGQVTELLEERETAWTGNSSYYSEIIDSRHTISRLSRERDEARRECERLADAAAGAVVDRTGIRGMTVEDGAAVLDLAPPRELLTAWVHAAREMLGDAPNYSETPVGFPREAASLEVHAADEPEWYVLTVQRKGKLTPHEARLQAEAERDKALESGLRWEGTARTLSLMLRGMARRATGLRRAYVGLDRQKTAWWDQVGREKAALRDECDAARADLAALRASADYPRDDIREQVHDAHCGCGEWDSHSQEYVDEMDRMIDAVQWRPSPVDARPQGTEDESPEFRTAIEASSRELLGRMVRQVWVKWAQQQPDPKSSWLVPWEDLDAGQREVDMLIGEALFERGRTSAVDARPGAPAGYIVAGPDLVGRLECDWDCAVHACLESGKGELIECRKQYPDWDLYALTKLNVPNPYGAASPAGVDRKEDESDV